jgi:hypothetical protein
LSLRLRYAVLQNKQIRRLTLPDPKMPIEIEGVASHAESKP